MSLIDRPKPPPITGARLIRGLSGGPDEVKPGPKREPRRLTAEQEHAATIEYREHREQLARDLATLRRAHTASRLAKIRELAKRYGVTVTAIEVCVGAR